MFLYLRYNSRRLKPSESPEEYCTICTTGTCWHYTICINSNFLSYFYFLID
nr:MAG TPA: hypothetical protein [Caudoviricetes sp.]